MATLLLAAATGGATPLLSLSAGQAFLAQAAAAVIDSYIFPALFKPDPVEGQRFNGMEVEHTEPGAGANRLFGKTVRVAGTRIWQSVLREVEDVENSGKGGGSGGEFVRFRYFRDVAVEICRLKRGKTIRGVRQVYANGKLFYNEVGLRNFSSIRIGVSLSTVNLPQVPLNTAVLVSDESLGGPILTTLQTGRNVTIGGFSTAHPLTATMTITSTGATAAQNGTGDVEIRVSCTATGLLAKGDTLTIAGVTGVYTVTESFRFTGTIGTPHVANIKISPGLAGNAGSGSAVGPVSGATANNGVWRVRRVFRISATQSAIAVSHPSTANYTFVEKDAGFDTVTVFQEDSSFSKSQAQDIRFYNGSRYQQPDPTILAQEGPRVGAANVLAYRGRAYMVIEDLEITDFGNIVPSFEFVVDVEEDDSLATALSEIVLDAGLPLAEQDFTSIPSTSRLGGYVMRGPQNLKAALQPVMLASHLVSQQIEATVRLLPRTATPFLDLTGKTGAFVPGSSRSPRPALFKGLGDLKTAQVAVLQYFDPAENYQINKKQAVGSVALSENLGEFNTQIVMTGDEAQQLVDALFEITRTAGRRSCRFDLPPSYISKITESYRVRIAALGQDRQYLVSRVEEGANWILNVEATEENLEAFDQTTVAEGSLAL